jgi:putative addiction module CopG family antidote
MNRHNLYLAPDMIEFVQTRVECGRYENASELMRAAFRALQCEERNSQAVQPTVAEGDVFRKLWEASVQPCQTNR